MALAACGAASAKPLPRYGVFVFSNLCVDRQGGDYGGERLTLIRRPEGDSLLYEYGNGPLSPAVAADNLRIRGVKLTGSAINDDQVVFLDATLSTESATLTAQADNRHLKRVMSYSASLPACR